MEKAESEETKQQAELMNRIKLIDEHSKKVEGKNLVVVLGTTGTGKSTYINYMYGCPMRRVDVEESFEEVIVASDPVTEIGHGRTSLTELPIVCPEIEGLTFADFPGFMDSRGSIIDISNAYATLKLMKECHSIKAIVILISVDCFKASRGKNIADLESLLGQLFGDRINEYEDSIWLGITKVPLNRSSDSLIKYLTNNQEENSTPELITRLAPRLFVYDPMDEHHLGAKNRLELLEIFQASTPIPNPAQIVQITLSEKSVTFIETMMVKITKDISQHLNKEKYSQAFKLLQDAQQLCMIPHRVVADSKCRMTDAINSQLQERADKIALLYNQENYIHAEKAIKQLTMVKNVFSDKYDIRISEFLRDAVTHQNAFQKRDEEKKEAQRQAHEAKKAAQHAVKLQKESEERSKKEIAKYLALLDQIKKDTSEDSKRKEERIQELVKKNAEREEEEKRSKIEKEINYNVRRQFKELLKNCPKNMRRDVERALDHLEMNACYIGGYCVHEDSLDDASYGILLWNSVGDKQIYSKRTIPLFQKILSEFSPKSPPKTTNEHYQIAYGENTENKANRWFKFSQKDNLRKLALKQHEEVLDGIKQFLNTVHIDFKETVREVLRIAQRDEKFIHICCQFIDNKYAISLRRSDDTGPNWSYGDWKFFGGIKWTNRADNHYIGKYYKANSRALVVFGKDSEKYMNKWSYSSCLIF